MIDICCIIIHIHGIVQTVSGVGMVDLYCIIIHGIDQTVYMVT